MKNKELICFLIIVCLIPVLLPEIVTIYELNELSAIEKYIFDPSIGLLLLIPFIVMFGIIISRIFDYQEIKTYSMNELKEEQYETVVVKSFCPNCHAPFEGNSKCAYCGYSFIKKVRK